MATFTQFIESIIADGNDGKAFEVFCKHFLETSPEYADKFERVWLWDNWPKKWSHDKGVDLIAKYKGRDKYCAIQAKCYGAHNTVPYNEVTNFLADSNRDIIEDRILMMSTDKLNEKTSKEVIVGQQKQVVIRDRHYFENINYDYPSHISELSKAKVRIQAKPRPHQVAAIDDVERGLSERDRGQLIMACGTGKTFTTLWIKERLKANTVLVLLPSLSLLSQTMREWVWGANDKFEALAVCSDPTVGKSKNGDEDISTAEVGKVTWHVDEIQEFLSKDTRKVIFCTYQSSALIEEAQRDATVPSFDLVVCDEAHRCAGNVEGGFATVLHEAKIRADKRLFTTATPRYYGKTVTDASDGRGVEIIGMDDEEKFGPIIHKLAFGEAIDLDLLTDYQVVVVGVDEPMMREWIARGEIVSFGDGDVSDARTLAAKLAVLKSIKNYDLKRLISFHSSIKRATDFSSDLNNVIDKIVSEQRPTGKVWSQHVDGTMSAGKRRELIKGLKVLDGYDIGILTNARCLSEGVDVPSLDGVAFVDPRASQVDIIQAVGRAIRKSEKKSKGTIILPVFLEKGDNPDSIIDSSQFKPIWDVLKALRAHDGALADYLDSCRTNLGLGSLTTSASFDKIVFDLPVNINANFSDSLYTRLIEETTSNWWFWFGLLKNYCVENNSALVPTEYKHPLGYRLGGWVDAQRQKFSRGELDDEQTELLLNLPDWFWNKNHADWVKGLEVLDDFIAVHGHAQANYQWVSPSGYRLGAWIANRRTDFKNGSLSEDKVNTLTQRAGWVWNRLTSEWDRNFQLLEAYCKQRGDCLVPTKYKTQDGTNLGAWVGTQRQRKNKQTQDRLAKLATLQGWYWDKFEVAWETAFQELKQYHAMHKKMPPQNYKTLERFSLGAWLQTQRLNKNSLTEDRLLRLNALGFQKKLKNDPDDTWDYHYQLLIEYFKEHANCLTHVDYIVNRKKLGRWVVQQRSRKRRLSSDRINRLDEIQFDWDPLATEWQKAYLELTLFFRTERHSNVPAQFVSNGIELGKWVRAQRLNRRPPIPERIQKLNEVQFIWDLPKYEWDIAFTKLKEFKNLYGHTRVPDKFKIDGFGIGGWCYRQRRNKNALQNWQLEKLNSIHFSW